MRHLARRIGLLEALAQSQEAQPCILVHRYRGETTADALRAESHDRVAPGRIVIAFRRPCQRDAAQGARR